MIAIGALFVLSSVSAKDEALDVQAFLPLFERNSIGRKTLDISYSVNFSRNSDSNIVIKKADVYLVFDAETEKYRAETKLYADQNRVDVYSLMVNIWDGNEEIVWDREVSKKPGYRVSQLGIYEAPGTAVVANRSWRKHEFYISFNYDVGFRLFEKSVREQNPKLGSIAEETITVETKLNTFTFSRKTGVLEKVEYYSPVTRMAAWRTYECSNHVEVSGVWMPLQVVVTDQAPDGSVVYSKTEMVVNPQALRLLDKVEDSSIFNIDFPTGCSINDLIRKKVYTVTTLDTSLPTDVDALKKTLDKMLEQAQEQKEEAEKK